MKSTFIAICFLLTFAAVASENKIVCNDQNSHTILNLEFNADKTEAQLITIQGDSSVIAEGTKKLKIQEGESSEDLSTFAGKTNNGKALAILLNLKTAATLKKYDILEVQVYYQPRRGDILRGQTTLLCSLN